MKAEIVHLSFGIQSQAWFIFNNLWHLQFSTPSFHLKTWNLIGAAIPGICSWMNHSTHRSGSKSTVTISRDATIHWNLENRADTGAENLQVL